MDQLAKQAAEIALRLAALPADGMRIDVRDLDAIEQMAIRILREVSAARAGKAATVGESSGVWRAMQPVSRS